MTTDPNLNVVAMQLSEQSRAGRSSTSIPVTARGSMAISVPSPISVTLGPAPNADVPDIVAATLEAARNLEASPDSSRARALAAQLKLAHKSDEHDPQARISQAHAALVEADAVALSQRIMRASMISDPVPVTIFDKIITKKIPALVVYEDDDVLAFHDNVPQAPVHIVIIPKFRDGLTGLSMAEERHKKILGQLLYTASRVAKMEEGLRDGYRVVINEGGWGGQTVLHLHLHLLGGRFMEWPPG